MHVTESLPAAAPGVVTGGAFGASGEPPVRYALPHALGLSPLATLACSRSPLSTPSMPCSVTPTL